MARPPAGPIELRIQATDPQAPVTGLVAGFGRGRGRVRPEHVPAPRTRRDPASRWWRRTLFATPGTRHVAARVTSAGCTGGQPSGAANG